MQRARAAIDHHGEAAGVQATLGGHGLHGMRHLRHRDAQDAVGRLGRIEPQRRRDALGHLALAAREVELEFAAQEVVGIEPAEHQIGVGHRRLLAAAAIGHRAGDGTRALRADPQRVAGLDAGDGAAAGADLVDVHHRNLDRQRALVAADQRRAGRERPAFADHAGLGGGAAHVEGDGVAHAELRADRLRTDHAGRRAGFQHAHAADAGMLDGEQAAGGLHHVEIALEALGGQVRLQLPQVL